MEKLALALVIASLATGCELYLDDTSPPDGSGAIVSDPDRLVGTWLRGGQSFEFTATDYLLIGSGDAAADSVLVLRVSVAFGRPDRIVLTDDRCGADLGTYDWQILRGTLSLAAVDDPCAARRRQLVGDYTDRSRNEPVLPEIHALSALDRHPWFEEGTRNVAQTACETCGERTTLTAWRRGSRMLVTERIVASDDSGVTESCELSTDVFLAPMRSFDPTRQLSSRSVVVESDCATPVGTVFELGWVRVPVTDSMRVWPLAASLVEPVESDVVTTFAPAMRGTAGVQPIAR